MQKVLLLCLVNIHSFGFTFYAYMALQQTSVLLLVHFFRWVIVFSLEKPVVNDIPFVLKNYLLPFLQLLGIVKGVLGLRFTFSYLMTGDVTPIKML